MVNISDQSRIENQNTHFVSYNFFAKIVTFLNNVEEYGRAGQAIDNNTAHAHYT